MYSTIYYSPHSLLLASFAITRLIRYYSPHIRFNSLINADIVTVNTATAPQENVNIAQNVPS